jgi:exosortase
MMAGGNLNTQEASGDCRASTWPTIAAWISMILALAAAFGYNFSEMWHRWFPAWGRSGVSLYEAVTQGQSYYTHSPIVPLVSLIIIALLIRHTSIPTKPRPIIGLAVLLLALLFHLLSCLARVNFTSGFAFVVTLIGLVLFVWGSTALKRLWFPLLFLLFMVPLPEVSIAQLNFRLKIAAADWGVQMANFIGIITERSGNQVFLEGDKSMIIANVCNGLRTLISVMAFAALYAYICRLRGLWRIALFAMAIPVAVISNAVRIISLIIVAHIWDVEIATG